MGCYVPCDAAQLTPVDRIFTRIGANDSILTGNFIFHTCTPSCVVIEIGPDNFIMYNNLQMIINAKEKGAKIRIFTDFG